MLRRGVARLWVLLSVIWLVSFAGVFAFRVYKDDACFQVFTISKDPTSDRADLDLIGRIEPELTSKPFCGKDQDSNLLTLETEAEKGAVTQVSFQWLEPSGWSAARAIIQILNGKDIKLSEIRAQTSDYVWAGRRRANYWLLTSGILIPGAVFLLGVGAIWVLQGFRKAPHTAGK